MERLEDIIKDVEIDADRDCCYNHDDLRNLANRLKRSAEIKSRLELGKTITLCGDPNFKATIMAVEETVNGTINFHLVWRDQRGFTDKWMDEAEIRALQGLEEN